MSILDWFKQPTCAELTPLVMALRDPLAYLDTDGSEGPIFLTFGSRRGLCDITGLSQSTFDYSVHAGWSANFTPGGDFVLDRVNCGEAAPYRRPVSREVLTNASEVIAAVRLLMVYYATPGALRLCPAAQGWFHARGRVRALTGIAAFGAGYGFGPDTAPVVTKALLKVFADPAGSKANAKETEVVYAAAQVVLDARTPVLDAATWLPVWRWALGGPNGSASVRTRVMAMKAIQAIIRRGVLMPRQVLAAATMADVLQQLVAGRAPSVAAGERAFFLSEADATVGAVNFALTQAALAEGKPPAWRPPSPAVRVGWWVVGVAAAAAVTVGGAAIAVHRRSQG